MVSHYIYQLAPLLLLPSVCAVVGFSLGRLIRGPRPKLDAHRACLAASSSYLRDAHKADLSPHTRMRCAFDSIYFGCLEVAGARGLDIDTMEHPSAEVLRAGVTLLCASSEDGTIAQLLADWAKEASPRLPSVSVDDACRLAAWVESRTASFLS